MLRFSRTSLGAFAVVFVGTWACSGAPAGSGSGAAAGSDAVAGSGSHEESGGATSGGASSGSVTSGGVTSGGAVGDATGGRPGASGGAADAKGGATSSEGGASGSTTGGASSSTGGGSGAGNAGTSGAVSSGVRSVFYLDVQGRVLGFEEDKPTPRTLVNSAGSGPDGIAVDLLAGHIFWTTMGVPADDDGSVRRANLDGSNVTTIVPAGGTYTPKQLRIDLAGKKLYWSDREGMRIQRAGLDGAGLETLVTVATGETARKDASNWCVGLALDLEHGFVYWTQKGPENGMLGSIRRAHIEVPAGETAATRTDTQVLFDKLPEPVDLDLDLAGGFMYWSDRGDDTINRGPIEIPSGKSAANRADRQILVRGVREAIGVTLDLERGHVYYTSGSGGRVGRANLDGSSAQDFFSGSGAFTGIAVVQQAGH